MEPIQTERLTIRNFAADDWRDLQEFAVQYQGSDVAQYDHPWPTDENGIKGAVGWFASGDQFLAVCLRPDGKLIGFVCLNGDEGADPNLGYGFNFDHHGAGYATEACRAMLARAFTECGVCRVVSGTAPENGPSCRLLARLGFRPQADVPNAYELTREEWCAARAAEAADA